LNKLESIERRLVQVEKNEIKRLKAEISKTEESLTRLKANLAQTEQHLTEDTEKLKRWEK
jgi:peptidoglycan hydrolase CwlO-like protein